MIRLLRLSAALAGPFVRWARCQFVVLVRRLSNVRSSCRISGEKVVLGGLGQLLRCRRPWWVVGLRVGAAGQFLVAVPCGADLALRVRGVGRPGQLFRLPSYGTHRSPSRHRHTSVAGWVVAAEQLPPGQSLSSGPPHKGRRCSIVTRCCSASRWAINERWQASGSRSTQSSAAVPSLGSADTICVRSTRSRISVV